MSTLVTAIRDLCSALFIAALLIVTADWAQGQEDRPNILWLTAEDMSPHLGCYGDAEAKTPRIDAFAREAVRYAHAFATAPVCSPARSCLITGMYATSLGTQRLRSQFPVPAEVRPFTAFLRAAGYYCTNNVKTDYNVQNEAEFERAAWDESSPQAYWRKRGARQPFFAVFNFMTTHQSRAGVWPQEQFEREVAADLQPAERADPAKLTLPPYYPDTAEARRAVARYRDCIAALDKQIGDMLDRLQSDGLADDTIVCFFSDHGMGMPRGKRCLFDSGLRVPLLIRVPPKWAHLSPGKPGEATDELVSFVDFAPTMLSLCGLAAPEHLQGQGFLGQRNKQPRRYVFGARDRVDEALDVARSVRDRRWVYIRNFMPHLSWMQPEGYSDGSTFRQELKRLAAEGKLAAGPLTYASPRRAAEELYDTEADPHQINNLASDQRYQVELERLRGELRLWQLETRDVGLLTEPQTWARLAEGGTPWSIARDEQAYSLERLLAVASAVGVANAVEQQRNWLNDANDGVRYWAALGLAAREAPFAADLSALRGALSDSSPVVRIEVAAALARGGEPETALPILTAALRDQSLEIRLHAARALELLGAVARPAHAEMQAALIASREEESRGSGIAMFIRFSLEAALSP